MKTKTYRHDRIISVLFFVVGLCLAAAGRSSAEEIDTTTAKEVYMIKGELVNLGADGLERISVTHPEVADIIRADEEEILMVGQSVGQTALFVWDKQGKRSLTVHVFSQDLELVKERVAALLKAADISEATLAIDGQEGKVVVSGNIPKHKKEQFAQIVEKFGDDVINLSKNEEIEDLIQIAVQITELSTTLSKSLGFEWFTGEQTTSGNTVTTTSSGGFTPTYGEIMPSLDGSVGDYFKIGQFERTINSALLAQINALLEQGKARILSQPKLVVKNGQEASFLVGGEIPIRTTTSTDSGGTQENVSFKQYGISMTITPEINKEKIDITLTVEISDVDSANAVGDDVAFTSRSAQTKLYLDDGQTIVLAGLIKQNRSVNLKKVPFLGDIPVLGLLFQNKSTPTSDQDQEVVISLTPTVLAKNRGKPPVVITKKIETEETSVTKEKPTAKELEIDQSVQSGAPVIPVAETEVQIETPSVAETIATGADEVPALSFTSVASTAASSSAESPSNIDEYVQAVQQKIAQSIVYPQEAERAGWEGTVKLSLLILSDGTLATAMVRESSGHEIFDEYTLNIVKKSAPYSSFPSSVDLQELNVTIPIVYSLKKN